MNCLPNLCPLPAGIFCSLYSSPCDYELGEAVLSPEEPQAQDADAINDDDVGDVRSDVSPRRVLVPDAHAYVCVPPRFHRVSMTSTTVLHRSTTV